MLTNFGEQYALGSAGGFQGSAKQLQGEYFQNILNNTRPIKKKYILKRGWYFQCICLH